MTTVALRLTLKWADYSASLPEKTKWRAEVYILSKICRSLHEWQEETASEYSEYFFLSIAISERKRQNNQKEIKRGTNLIIEFYSPDRKSERIRAYE